VTTHSFRKTVATALDLAGLSARSIAEYLGPANPSITQDVYMSRTAGGTKAAEALAEILGAE
jgi:integrase